MHRAKSIAAAVAVACLAIPETSFACACGCGVFDVGTGTMMPNGEGGTVFMEWDYMNQNRNWSGTSKAPSDNNGDKDIKTHFITAGFQYMFNRTWGVMTEVPYWDRDFKTTDANGNIATFNTHGVGDVRIKGIYTGFSEDLSSGLTFGLKLPTGPYGTTGLFDRDTRIGTGSTDLLLGGFHVGQLTADNKWNWFANAQVDVPMLKTTDYRPGEEIDTLAGVYFNDWTIMNDAVKLVPIAQAKFSWRWRDVGTEALYTDSGYQRLYLSPAMEVDIDRYRFYADVAIPVYTHAHGNQLVADQLFKVIGAISF